MTQAATIPFGGEAGTDDAGTLWIPWRQIRPMPNQPREFFDRNALEELAASIKAIGQVVPVLVAKMARQPNHPMEIAAAISRMCRKMSQAQCGAILGKSTFFISTHLSLLNLCPEATRRMHPSTPKETRLTVSVGVQLAKLAESAHVRALDEMDRSGLLPGRAAERFIPRPSKKPGEKGRTPIDDFRILSGRLKRSVADLEVFAGERGKFAMRNRRAGEIEEVRRLTRRIDDLAKQILGLTN